MLKFRRFIIKEKATWVKKSKDPADDVDQPEEQDTDMSNPVFGLFRRSSPVVSEQQKLPFGGVYSYFPLVWFSATTLHKWASQYVTEPVSPEKLHSTVVYTETDLPSYQPFMGSVILDPRTYAFDILGGAWVLKYFHPIPDAQWHKAKDLGAELTFDKYIPHITLSYNPGIGFDYHRIPIPKFPITLSREIKQGLYD